MGKFCSEHDPIFGIKNENSLYSFLKRALERDFETENENEVSINSLERARIPIIEIHLHGIELDVLAAAIPYDKVPETWDLVNHDNEENIRKNNLRMNFLVNKMLESGSKFYTRSILTLIEKQIYSNVFGYFNGASLLLLAAKICLLYPSANLTFLLKQFFLIFSIWDWPKPVLLENLTDENLAKSLTKEAFHDYWQLKNVHAERMPIISSTFPEQNTMFNVNEWNLKLMMRKMKEAYDLLEQSSDAENTQILILNNLFKKFTYETNFQHFILIVCAAENSENERVKCGLPKITLRTALLNWVQSAKIEQESEGKIEFEYLHESLDEYHLLSGFEEKGPCLFQSKFIRCVAWLVGVNFKTDLDSNMLFFEQFNAPAIWTTATVESFVVNGSFALEGLIEKIFRNERMPEAPAKKETKLVQMMPPNTPHQINYSDAQTNAQLRNQCLRPEYPTKISSPLNLLEKLNNAKEEILEAPEFAVEEKVGFKNDGNFIQFALGKEQLTLYRKKPLPAEETTKDIKKRIKDGKKVKDEKENRK